MSCTGMKMEQISVVRLAHAQINQLHRYFAGQNFLEAYSLAVCFAQKW